MVAIKMSQVIVQNMVAKIMSEISLKEGKWKVSDVYSIDGVPHFALVHWVGRASSFLIDLIEQRSLGPLVIEHKFQGDFLTDQPRFSVNDVSLESHIRGNSTRLMPYYEGLKIFALFYQQKVMLITPQTFDLSTVTHEEISTGEMATKLLAHVDATMFPQNISTVLSFKYVHQCYQRNSQMIVEGDGFIQYLGAFDLDTGNSVNCQVPDDFTFEIDRANDYLQREGEAVCIQAGRNLLIIQSSDFVDRGKWQKSPNLLYNIYWMMDLYRREYERDEFVKILCAMMPQQLKEPAKELEKSIWPDMEELEQWLIRLKNHHGCQKEWMAQEENKFVLNSMWQLRSNPMIKKYLEDGKFEEISYVDRYRLIQTISKAKQSHNL